MTTTIPFIAYEISGVKVPTYSSGAANKAYVDAQVVAGGGVATSAFQTLTAASNAGIYFDGTLKVSSQAARQISVLGYSTISSNAKKGQASGALLGTWVGSPNITTVGTIGTGTWNATTIAYGKLDAGIANISSTAYKAKTSAQSALYDADFAANGLMSRTAAGVYTNLTDNTGAWNSIVGSGLKYTSAYKSASTGVFAIKTRNITTSTGLTGGGDLSADRTLSVLGYATISANAANAAGYMASGNEYSKAYSWFNASANLLSVHENSTTIHVTAADKTTWNDISASGNEYTKAYLSGQRSKIHAYHAKISSSYLAAAYGWQAITSGSHYVTHGLSGTPNIINITPSGLVTFSYAVYNVGPVQFTVAITAAGSRVIKWHAQI